MLLLFLTFFLKVQPKTENRLDRLI